MILLGVVLFPLGLLLLVLLPLLDRKEGAVRWD